MDKEISGLQVGLTIGGLVIAVIFILSIILGSWGIVDPGERGVKVRLGVIKATLNPGPYVKIPFIDSVVKMNVRTQTLEATKDQPLSASSNDIQDTRLAVVVNYRIEPSTVANIYQQYGDAESYYHSVVEPLIVATIKGTVSQYTAVEQVQKRPEMTTKAIAALNTAFEGKNVVIEKADITDVAFSKSFTDAIEAKVTAVQNAEAAKNNLEKVKFEAQQKIETAKAEAEAIRIQAQAVNSQGGADYVALQWIKAWEAGGAKVPEIVTSDNAGGFIMNLNR